jgi:endonuclease III related protein
METVGAQRAANEHEALQAYHQALLARFGPQRWWPARTRLEVVLGAILVQNTAWKNAALALRALRRAHMLGLAPLRGISSAELERLVRPAGFYRQKARAIKTFVDWLFAEFGGSLNRLFLQPDVALRRQLLDLKGIGPETADAILLYAAKRPVFVPDAYSRRILSRHRMFPADWSYAQGRQFFQQNLPADAAFMNEFHALLVEAGKRYCRKGKPDCQPCPLAEFLPRFPIKTEESKDRREATMEAV